MTDRLKEWLDEVHPASHCASREAVAIAALRAVVELHREAEGDDSDGSYAVPSICSECASQWPCPTIRSVEKKVLK